MNIKPPERARMWSVAVTMPPKTALPEGFEPIGYYSAGRDGTMNVGLNVVAETFEQAMERTKAILPECTFVTVSKGRQIHLP